MAELVLVFLLGLFGLTAYISGAAAVMKAFYRSMIDECDFMIRHISEGNTTIGIDEGFQTDVAFRSHLPWLIRKMDEGIGRKADRAVQS